MNSRSTHLTRHALVLGLALLVTAPGAQAQVTTGGITGQVLDSTGAPVADATVEVVNSETGLRRTVTVNQRGNYTVLGLTPGGPYRVAIRAIGHRPVVREGVRVPLSQTVRTDATLARQAVQVEELVVVADAGTDFAPSRQGAQTTINDTLLRRLPTLDRDFTDFVKLTPQVQVREGEGGITAAGQNNRYNTIQVDGATVNDRFGLGRTGQAGGQADGRSVGLEAVKEYQVLLSPYDVRHGNFSGALINAVTKSGTNRFSGSVFGYHRNEGLTGFPVSEADFSTWQFGASLGGPIQRDRIHFFANFERRSEDKPAAGPFFGGADVVVVSPADIAAYNATATAFGLSSGSFDRVDITRPATNLLGRLDFLLGNNSRLVAKFQYNQASLDVFDRSTSLVNPFIELSNNGYFFDDDTYNPSLQFFTNFANGAANELLMSANIIRDRRTPFVREPVILVQNYPQAGDPTQSYTIVAGGEEFSHANELDQDIYEITDNFSIPLGAHRLTVGARWEGYRVRNLFGQNTFGRWQFDNQADFDAGAVEQYQIRFGLPGSNEGESRFRAGQFAVYAQDDWAVTPAFTLNPGLRLDMPYFTTALSYDSRVIEDFGAQDKPGGGVMVSPRLGFNWDIPGEGQSQLRGGAGVFTGAPAFVWYSNAYANNGLGLVALTCDVNAGQTPPAFSPDPDNPPISCASGETVAPGGNLGEVDLVAGDTKFPQVFRANLAYDRRLPYGLVASVEGLYSKDINQFFIVNRNLLAPARTDATGRVIYPGTVNANGTLSPLYFDVSTRLMPLYGPSFSGGVYELRNTDAGYSWSLTGQLRKEFGQQLQASVGYTYSEAYDVQSFTSSRAISNWRFSRMLTGPDLDDTRTRSSFDRPHRIVGNLTFTFPWRLPTDISFTYIGQAGTPYTLRTGGSSGRGDLNLDGTNTNDAIYIPTGAGDPNSPYVFQTPASEAAFEEYISGESCLTSQRGRVMERNSCRNPWQNQLDVALRQRLPVLRGDAALEIQIFNFLRMLDRDWGQVKTVGGGEFFDQEVLTAVDATDEPDPTVRRHIVTFNQQLLTQRFQPVSSNASINRSTYYIQAGLRYSF
ncbi:MAG TPA: carboxypeptidase regulatory-like domain-containing protein [Gemmatimonadales bacterium]|nr:carboxypeptidase regulatory-like domain-containing protein [Gemmatimonadales bacterium]